MPTPMLRAPLLPVACVILLAGAAAAQGGYTKESFPDLGIELERPRDYEQIPTQPDEQFIVLYFAEKLPKDPDERRAIRPELWVLSIDYVPDPVARESEPGPPEGDPGESEASEPPPPPVNSLERWLERHSPWDVGRPLEAKAREGWTASSYSLVPRQGPGDDVLWCYAFVRPGKRTVAFLARCAKADFEDQERIWRRVAERCELSEPESANLAKLRQKYARSDLRGIDYRVGVRSKLVRGWKAEDTENFIVVYSTKDQPLVRNLVADIESIRHEYIKLFPPAGEITAVSTVRVCKDLAEYLAYGGRQGSAGYWNAGTEELVFYDASVVQQNKRKSGDENTFIVLYHEAFHQYIHYSAGELPPHSWFNEGHGDYFSGADVFGNKVRKIGVNPWRIGLIQNAIERRKYVPWREILEFEQAEYYRTDRVGLCYAQGWSMIYFLRTAPAVARHPLWSRILDTYFRELKHDYAAQLARLAAAGTTDDRRLRSEAGIASRKHALERAFEGVDLAALEAEWASYVSKLKFKP
jgi:hypothetical protein